MDSPEYDTLIVASEASSPGRLLESGFLCVRQGRYAEGITFFALARERLSPDQAHLAAVLDAFTRSHEIYSQAQEELLQASKRFVRADAEQQVQIAALENLLALVPEEMKKVFHNVDGLQHNARGNRLLHVLRSSPEDFNDNQMSMRLPQKTVEDNRDNQPLPPTPHEDNSTLPGLYITCFGRFEVKRLGKPVVLCSNRHGQTILRYLVAQSEHCATSDTLMTLLWPEDEPEVTQPRLHTAICALRRSLNHGYTCEPGYGYIVCKNRTYYLSTAVPIQTDVDQFLHYYQAGRQSHQERIALYEKACHLYTGPFLREDKYADWPSLQREHLCRLYIDMCRILSEQYLQVKRYEEAEKWANAVLKENQCDELAYRQLMRIYAAQGRRSEALQLYQRCERVLSEELAVPPMTETVHLMQMLLKSDPSFPSEGKI